MGQEAIPEDIQRFILTSIRSVPHLEAILLMRTHADRSWDGKEIGQRLYLSEKNGTDILSDLYAAGFLSESAPGEPRYTYAPHSQEMALMVDRLAKLYATNIVSVANLIHSNLSNQAQQFADAFKWRKDS